MPYLICIAIGPVQEFIASARRSRDLWYGSWLLSELSKAVAKAIGKENLIFPAIEIENDSDLEEGSAFNVVNKIVAIIEPDNPNSFGDNLKAKINDRLAGLRETAFSKIAGKEFFLENKAIAQIEDLVEFYWAAVPLNEDYEKARQQVEALLAARKSTREFIAPDDWAGNDFKSSLDGFRESVISDVAYKTLSPNKLRNQFGIRAGERLCGVGLLKRLGNRGGDDKFFSTSHIAALPLISSLKKEQKSLIDSYISALTKVGIGSDATYKVPQPKNPPEFMQAFPYDGHLLFEERLKDYFEKDQEKDLKDAQAALKHLRKEIFSDKNPREYYAVLHGDGDRMGAAIDQLKTPEAHRNLSRKLSEFASQVKDIVEESPHYGSLVYAGGDDVLALLPLHTAIQCAQKLAGAFAASLSEFDDGRGHNPTLSVGIAISHHIEPLADALDLARAAEKEAKRVDGKNALCIKLSKRSGSVTTVADNWGTLDKRLDYFTLLHLAEAVPDGAAYELRELAKQLKYVPDAIKPEAIRILKRKRAEKGEKELDKNIIERLEEMIESDKLAALADELIVARLLAETKEQSGMTAEQAKEALLKEATQ